MPAVPSLHTHSLQAPYPHLAKLGECELVTFTDATSHAQIKDGEAEDLISTCSGVFVHSAPPNAAAHFRCPWR